MSTHKNSCLTRRQIDTLASFHMESGRFRAFYLDTCFEYEILPSNAATQTDSSRGGLQICNQVLDGGRMTNALVTV